MNKKSFQTSTLFLGATTASSNTQNYDMLWNNINFRTLLGDEFELGATYNLILRYQTDIGSVNYVPRINYHTIDSNCMNFKQSTINNNGLQTTQLGVFFLRFVGSNTLNHILYDKSNICSFVLIGERGYIRKQIYSGVDNATGISCPGHITAFDIVKVLEQ